MLIVSTVPDGKIPRSTASDTVSAPPEIVVSDSPLKVTFFRVGNSIELPPETPSFASATVVSVMVRSSVPKALEKRKRKYRASPRVILTLWRIVVPWKTKFPSFCKCDQFPRAYLWRAGVIQMAWAGSCPALQAVALRSTCRSSAV